MFHLLGGLERPTHRFGLPEMRRCNPKNYAKLSSKLFDTGLGKHHSDEMIFRKLLDAYQFCQEDLFKNL